MKQKPSKGSKAIMLIGGPRVHRNSCMQLATKFNAAHDLMSTNAALDDCFTEFVGCFWQVRCAPLSPKVAAL